MQLRKSAVIFKLPLNVMWIWLKQVDKSFRKKTTLWTVPGDLCLYFERSGICSKSQSSTEKMQGRRQGGRNGSFNAVHYGITVPCWISNYSWAVWALIAAIFYFRGASGAFSPPLQNEKHIHLCYCLWEVKSFHGVAGGECFVCGLGIPSPPAVSNKMVLCVSSLKLKKWMGSK